MTGTLRYGKQLIDAGVSGIRAGQDAARGQDSLSSVAADAARDSLALAAVGAGIGLLHSCLTSRRNRLSSALVLGFAGSALGFTAGFAWNTRRVTTRVANSAKRELRKARDAHWLELNPIDYA